MHLYKCCEVYKKIAGLLGAKQGLKKLASKRSIRVTKEHTGPLDLEPVRLLSRGRSPPLDEVVVRSVQVLVQLDHQRLEERGKLSLRLRRVRLEQKVQQVFYRIGLQRKVKESPVECCPCPRQKIQITANTLKD